MRVLSWRWWFEDRRTGQITVAQLPNWPIYAIAGVWAVGRLTDDGSVLEEITSWAGAGLWCYWGADELVRGVNPWRRALGASAIAWQVVRLLR